MRIVFLLSQSLDSPSGRGRYFQFAKGVVARGHDVHIVALHHDLQAISARHFVQDGVEIHYVAQMHVRKVDDTTLYYGRLHLLWLVLIAAIRMTITAIRLRPDIVHVGKPHPQNSIAGLVASKWCRAPMLVDCDDLEATSNYVTSPLQAAILQWLEHFTPKWADGVTTHSALLYSRLLASGVPGRALIRVPSPIDASLFVRSDAETAAAWRRALQLDHARIVLYTGTLSLANHPVDLLLRAFSLVQTTVSASRLVVVGGGKDLERLKQMALELGIAQQCRFTGRIAYSLMPVFYTLADCTVDPVEADDTARARWPLKIIESLACGTPVVTGDVGDRREMLDNGRVGVLVAPGDAGALAAGISAMLEPAAASPTLAAACRQATARYTLDDVTAQLLAFYAQIAQGRAGKDTSTQQPG